METFGVKEELQSDLIFSALSKMSARQDALENLVKALQRKVKILSHAMATGKCIPPEDISKLASYRESSTFAELIQLREENFQLKREIQRLDHALELARGLDLDLGGSSPVLQNNKTPVYFGDRSNAFLLDDNQCQKPNISSDSYRKYFEFQRSVSQTKTEEGNQNYDPKGCQIPTEKESDGHGIGSSIPHPSPTSNERQHCEKCPCRISPYRHMSERFSTNQQEEESVVQSEAPPIKRTGRSDRIKYALGHTQSSTRDGPSSLPKRTREDIRQQLLEDAFLVLKKSGGRYIKENAM